MVVSVVFQAPVVMVALASMAWVRVVETLAPRATGAPAAQVALRQREPPALVAPVEAAPRVAPVAWAALVETAAMQVRVETRASAGRAALVLPLTAMVATAALQVWAARVVTVEQEIY